MRQIRYSVAMSLDGYIAGPAGEHDWILMDPAIDFAAMFSAFDTVLMGRRTFEQMIRQNPGGQMPGMRTYVFSRTLDPAQHPKVTVVADRGIETAAALRKELGKDIWLMGGGVLFGSLLAAGLVDTVETAIVPTLLGGGRPLLSDHAGRASLELASCDRTPLGLVTLCYKVPQHA